METDARPEVSAWLQALFDASPMAIGFARDGVTLDVNDAYVRLFGWTSAAELRGRPLLELIAPSHRPQIAEMIAQRARGESTPSYYETRGLRRDGTEFPFAVTTTRVVVADGPLSISFIADVSEREATLAALRASEERFRTLSGAAEEGVFIHADGKVVLVNEAGAKMYGYAPSEMIGLPLLDLAAPDSRAAVIDNIQRGASDAYEGVALRKDGSTFAAEVRGRTLLHQGRPARVALIRDVTERKRVEAEQRALAERVRHAQKLESLGVLAGGVAHDFNNILTVIANGVTLAKRDSASGEASAHLDTIALATDRAADLCRQMLAYAGKATFAREAVDLNALVAEMSSMLDVSIAKKATLVRDLLPELPLLLVDATQIRQIVMNLVLNASEALGPSGGTVRVATGAGTFDAGAFARSPAGGDPKAGAYVWLEVRDDGVGMDAATLAQMFDPFFTTKFVGRGLGMAAVLGIVRAHAGAIDVESAPGRGTTIRVFFPAADAARDVAPRAPAPRLEGRGLVLVVDDEPQVRRMAELLLRDFGFDVLVAADGAEAIDVLRANADRVDAVLLDRTMPRMDGIETLRELRRIAPAVPVVMTSGYGATIVEGTDARPDAVLGNPYSADALLAALRQIMRPLRNP